MKLLFVSKLQIFILLSAFAASGSIFAHSASKELPCNSDIKRLRARGFKVVAIGDGLRKRAIEKVDPGLDAHLKKSAAVSLQLLIDTSGRPVCVKPIEGHPLLLNRSIHAAREWKFQPMKIQKKKVAFYGNLKFTFSLQDRKVIY